MAEESFSSLGRTEAIAKLYEGTTYKPFEALTFETSGRSVATMKSRTLLEGIDFDLVYFPLKHLGYKSVIEVTGELYAALAQPRTLDVVLGVSAKLDYAQIKEIWEGIATAATEHGYSKVGLDLEPSRNGLSISVSACGETTILEAKRRPAPRSMDLICISGNLGAAYLGLSILEREKTNFAKDKSGKQPELEKYKMMIGSYLKPELPAGILKELSDAEIVPSSGYFVTRGLASTLNSIVRDSGLGAKIYMERMPFAGNSFDTGKELDIDPVTAALKGGDDCRLLFTVPISKSDKFRHDFQTFEIIGHLAKPDVGAVIVTPDGLEMPIK